MIEKCPYCKTDSKLYFCSKDYNRKISLETFYHYLCPKCGLIFIAPFPQNLRDYYPNEYHFIPETKDFIEINSVHEKYKIEIIERFINKGRLLEIGPSLGGFSFLAKKSGFEVEAIEMDTKSSIFMNEILEINTVNTDDICMAIKDLKPFDVIAMWHVIEHLPSPWTTLEKVYEMINHGGILVLAAPNPHAFQFQVLKQYWPHVDAPRHLMLIPAKQLVAKMETLGMSVELITTSDEGGLGWNIFGWEYFFSNLSNYKKLKKILRHLGRLVAKLFSPIENLEGKGSAYTIVFRKKWT